MNTHHANPHVPRRNRHLFDPSRIKIGIEDIRERGGVEGGVEEAGVGGKEVVQVQVQEKEGRGMMKRQWHDPWSIATAPPAYLSASTTAAAVGKSTVVVTRIKGTTVVTGTPPPSTTSAKAPTTTSSVKKAGTTTTPAVVISTTAPRPTTTSTSPKDPETTTTSTTPTSTTTPSEPSTTAPTTPLVALSTTPASSSSTTLAAIAISSLPASVRIATALTLGEALSSTSASGAKTVTRSATGTGTGTSAVESAAATSSALGTAEAVGASSQGSSEGMSTGSKVGIAVGVVGGLAVLGLVLFWAFKRFSRDKQSGHMEEPSYTNGNGGSLGARARYNDYDDGDWHAPAGSGYGGRGYAGTDVDRYDEDGDVDERQGQAVFATRQGAGPGISSIQQHNQMRMAHPYAATSYATYSAVNASAAPGSARTRDLTNVGPYATYNDDDVDRLPEQGYQGRYRDTGRDSPTDYYGHAMSSANTDMMIAAQYSDLSPSVDEGHFAHQPYQQATGMDTGMGTAIASPYAGGMAITNGEPVAAQRVPINVGGNGPQIPPLGETSPADLMDYGMYADDAQQKKLLSRKSSQAQPRAGPGHGNEQLRQEYRDLARAAQVEEPMTPNTAALASSLAGAGGGFAHELGDSTSSRRSGPAHVMTTTTSMGTPLTPMPMPPPERYQHGQPLTTLPELETPDSRMMPGNIEMNPFVDLPGFAAHLPPARSSAESLALPLPRPNYSHIDARYDTLSMASNDSSVLPSHYGVPNTGSTMYMPPPSPGVLLPESPASYVDPSRQRFIGQSLASAVSLHVPSPEESSRPGYRVSATEIGWSPASGPALAAHTASPLNQATLAAASRMHHAQSASRPYSTATDVDDAYEL
ncbi:hypothetical protein QFC24_002249 [Naganishia onofrii]|uniref:Uncharacterized protein n=1 Tax=Naganishia onofrii TaxID=1851511 RepID=A0ACC2XPT4_9TREE|nr:hypothetical protein QFC24_002249 [Naganishia onofrii]